MKKEVIRLLVIEDSQDDIRIVKRRLEKYHFDAAFVASAEEAMQALKEKEYDAVLVDYLLPRMNGLDLLDGMKKDGYDTPVVMVTGVGTEKIAVEAMKKGAYDYLIKSQDPGWVEVLPSVIQKAVERYRTIKERDRAQEALQESEGSYRTLAENLPGMVYRVHIREGNRMQFFNSMVKAMTGYEADELKSGDVCSIESLIVAEDRAGVVKTMQKAVQDNAPFEIEYRLQNRSGKIRHFLERGRPMRGPDDKPLYIDGVILDITERRHAEQEKEELERKLLQSRKLEAIGTLAGGIAHNFNNLLMAIVGNVSLMLFDVDPAHPHYEYLQEIKNQVKDGTRLSAQLLGYARKGQYHVRPLNLNDLVARTSETICATRRDITVRTELSGDLSAIRADRSQIQQVLLNLFINAADAMPYGGDLTLKTSNTTDRGMKGKIYDPKPGRYVKLTVTDKGKGMDKETMERVFEPFFTTKEVGRGTGLGLASTYGIVKAHAGYIDVESELGCGTTFIVYLPAAEEEAEETDEPLAEIAKGTGTILLVDDEDRILGVGRRLLEKLGYTVIEARSGKEAVDIYLEHKAGIDLVVLDIIMPGMGGGEVYDKMKEINPDARVLLSSGYDIDKEAREILACGCDGFIQKPFDLQGLSQKIREVLDRK